MYLDTSVAVSLYVREPQSDECEAVVTAGSGVFSSELLRAELLRAMLAKEKNQLITAALRREVLITFEEHVAEGRVQLIAFDGLVVREAMEVMERVYPEVLLRTLDAIHLATFLSVDAGPLFTRDQRMRDAAARLGIPLAG